MSKRCPPGVICFENITIVIIIVLLCGVLLYVHFNTSKKVNRRQPHLEDMQLNPGSFVKVNILLGLVPTPYNFCMCTSSSGMTCSIRRW